MTRTLTPEAQKAMEGIEQLPEPIKETLSHVDRLLKLAETNGWNAAINTCREQLPPEYSQRLRGLYRIPP